MLNIKLFVQYLSIGSAMKHLDRVTIRVKHLEQTLPGNMSLEMNIKFRHEHNAGILKFVSKDFSTKSISISIKFSSIFSNIRTFWSISTHTISIFKYSETSISIPSNYWWNFNIDLNYCEDQSVWRSIVTPLLISHFHVVGGKFFGTKQ